MNCTSLGSQNPKLRLRPNPLLLNLPPRNINMNYSPEHTMKLYWGILLGGRGLGFKVIYPLWYTGISWQCLTSRGWGFSMTGRETLNRKPLNPKPQTPKPQTLNPKPLNPKPQTPQTPKPLGFDCDFMTWRWQD